ncbi:MAG: hypothetical protein AMXMBFR36_26520 [Acidobacteriota bacterium]
MIVRPATRVVASVVVAASLALLPAGCRRGDSAATPAADSAPAQVAVEDDIAWFEGSVEQAFATAAAERKPLFLYWGAVWCPPCHALRTRIFPRPEIRARLAAAVPVYLDGDTERAQVWGEKLGTAGYPTVIVFDPDGREVTRLPGVLGVEDFAELLTTALDAAKPLAERIAEAERVGPTGMAPAELELLAFHAWYQDERSGLDDTRRKALFERFWRETPTDRPVVRSRFFAAHLGELAREESTSPLDATERDELVAALETLLSDREQRAANIEVVLYGAGRVVARLAPEPGALRDRLIAAWQAAARALEDDESWTTNDRLEALAPRIELARLVAGDGAPLPAELLDRVRERVRWAEGRVRDDEEMQAVMSTMAGLLEDAGLADETRALLSEKAASTVAPYYYTGWLAGLEADAGRTAESVALYRRAWQEARAANDGTHGPAGRMTPLRWGSSYLRQAMKQTPDATEVIAADLAQVLDDALAGPDAFAGGNWGRLESLAAALLAWQGAADAPAERAAVVDAARERVRSSCAALGSAAPGVPDERCRGYLAEPASV